MIGDELWRSVYGPWQLLTIALAAGLLILSPGLFRRDYRKIYMALMGLYIAALIIGWNLDWSPTKPFHRFYRGIQLGMSIEQVQQQLSQFFPPNGPYPKPPTETGQPLGNGQITHYFRLAPLPPTAAVITVDFEQGRVTNTEYSPD